MVENDGERASRTRSLDTIERGVLGEMQTFPAVRKQRWIAEAEMHASPFEFRQ